MTTNTKLTIIPDALALTGSKTKTTIRGAVIPRFPLSSLIVTGVLLSLTSITAFASTMTTYVGSSPAGCVTGVNPSAPTTPGNNQVSVNLTSPSPCIGNFGVQAGPDTTYFFTFSITNNTGQTMTDLHIGLGDDNGVVLFNLPATSDVLPYSAGTSTNTLLNFIGPPNLLNGSTDTVTLVLDLPPNILPDRCGAGSGICDIVITPSFGGQSTTPEPASLTLALSGCVFVGLGAWRRRRGLRGPEETAPKT
jgi:hypothetical protein